MLVHSNFQGPSKLTTLGGVLWFVTFINDCTRMKWVVLIKNKSKVFSVFHKFHKMVTIQYKVHVQVLHSDNGRVQVNNDLRTFLDDHGIVHQTTCSYTPQENVVAE